MSTSGASLFEAYLNQYDSQGWNSVLLSLMPSIHEVDKTATQIWFAFYPLALAQALDKAEDPEQLAKKLQLSGKYRLKDQIATSHEFLYGHRYWPQVRQAVIELASSERVPSSLELAAQIREVAGRVASLVKAEASLVTGITAVAFMTLQQVGFEAFKTSPSATGRISNRSPEQVLKERARDDDQGLFGFLKGVKKDWTVTFDEHDPNARFRLINSQEITTAAACDKRDYRSRDPRCIEGGGPIPIECRSAACGTCWVGVLGGAEKLSSVSPREARKIKEFGYIDTIDPKPLIRLACVAQASGAVSIVIPPWNGVFGKYIRGEKSLLEDAEAART